MMIENDYGMQILRRIMEARGTPLILGMMVTGVVSVGCGHGTFKRPNLCGPLVLVLDLYSDEFGCLVHPSGVTFLLLNLDRQKKLHGARRWIAQRLELAGSD